ncbi:hypothetical protein KP509_33G011600 [Ceratopteris richardii]|nr:hypothetical protein KP509_33G011600 [Ceratopteris richardii]
MQPSSITKEVGRSHSLRLDSTMVEALRERFEQVSFGCKSSDFSIDGFSSGAFSTSFCPSEQSRLDDTSSSTGESSSPLSWFPHRGDQAISTSSRLLNGNAANPLSEKNVKELSELDMMKEKFAKLLLGEDMSGGGKGVSSALAISNAITNLSATVFGEIWKLEPLSAKRKSMWRREMDWLASIADHIVELVPSVQTFPNGSSFEVMVTRPRQDLQLNLPALRKLETMLLECLDNFSEAEFWYVDQGTMKNDVEDNVSRQSLQRNEEKWWLPTVKVPADGLSENEKKRLQHQRDCINQVLKAARAINSQVLSEMVVPDAYWKALPKNGKTCLGEAIYKNITSESFTPKTFLSTCDLSNEHQAVELANRMEAVIHAWHQGRQPWSSFKSTKDSRKGGKNSWGMVKEFVSDAERREFLAERAEEVLFSLKQKFPGLRQSLLDMMKIQYNKDVGQSILESYSRVMESLAASILARIDDIIFVDDVTKQPSNVLHPPFQPRAVYRKWARSNYSSQSPCVTPFKTPHTSPIPSPTASPTQRQIPNSPLDSEQNQVLSDYVSFSYEVDLRSTNCSSHGSKKLPVVQQRRVMLLSRSMNSIRSQSIHPIQDE